MMTKKTTVAVVVAVLAVAILGAGLTESGLDSNFGHEWLGPNATSIEGFIKGSWFVCPSDGTANSITAYIKCTEDKKVKGAIYAYVSDDDAGALIGGTEELIVRAGYEGWETFNLSSPKPPVSANTKYFLMMFGEKTTGLSYLYWTATGATAKSISLYISYNDFPNPIIGETGVNEKYRIFCTYTPTVPFVPPTAPPPQKVIIRPPNAKLKLLTHGTYIDFVDVLTAERIIVNGDNVQFEEALLGAGDRITTTIELTGGDAKMRTLSEDLVELTASASSGTITEFTMTASRTPDEVRVYGTPVRKSDKGYYLATQPNINTEISMWGYYDGKVAVKFVHKSSVGVVIDFVKETVFPPVIPPAKLREFSVAFMPGVLIDTEFGSKEMFTLDENIILRVHVEDAATGAPVRADIIMWYNAPVMHTIDTVDLGEGVYEGSIPASDVGIGTFQAGVDVQMQGFNKASDTLTFTIAEELPLSLWESPIFWAGISGLAVALAIVALWLKGVIQRRLR